MMHVTMKSSIIGYAFSTCCMLKMVEFESRFLAVKRQICYETLSHISSAYVLATSLQTVPLQSIIHKLDEYFTLGKGTVRRGITDMYM